MQEFLVRWEIDIPAETPEEAARLALQAQRDPSSIATFFRVKDSDGKTHHVDVKEE